MAKTVPLAELAALYMRTKGLYPRKDKTNPGSWLVSRNGCTFGTTDEGLIKTAENMGFEPEVQP